MYYVETNADILDRLQMIKEQQKALFENMCCKQRRFKR